MKKTELKSLRTKKLSDLKGSVSKKKLEIAKVLAKISAGQEKNLKKAWSLKKDLTQTLTLIKEMEIMEKFNKKEEKK